MINPFSILRVLSLALAVVLALWVVRPQSLDANSRTYTAEYVPDRIADGFDFPVGRNGSAAGYYMARRMAPYDHLGDDWNGVGGGNSDYGDPIYSIADGVVVYSENFGSNWGQVVIVRHKYREKDGSIQKVDSLYGHVINRRVAMGDTVRRGQQIAQIGNNNGMYLAHLHLEIRRNTDIGIQSWNFSKGLANYHRPDQFIASHRPGKLPDAGLRLASAPVETTKPETAPAPAPAAPEMPVASKPLLVAEVTAEASPKSKPVVTETKAPSASASSSAKGFYAAYGPAAEPRVTEAVFASRRSPSRTVVDELVSPAKKAAGEKEEREKTGPRLFAGMGQPERVRLSRKPSAAVDREPATAVKSTAARRRSFGKQ